MSTGIRQPGHPVSAARPEAPVDNTDVRRVLHQIVESPAFKGSWRSQQFLQHIVEKALSGHAGELKERSLGVELFGRSCSYDTGEDAIVRVTASDVRKRLHHFYSETGSDIRIEIPSGSYTPEFRRKTAALPPATASPPGNEPALARAQRAPWWSRRRNRICSAVFGAAVVLAVGWLWFAASRVSAQNVLPWSALFRHGRVHIVFADPDLSTMQDWLGIQVSLSDYANRHYLPDGRSFGPDLERALRSLHGVNVAAVDAGIAVSISRLAASSAERLEIHPARSLQLKDFKTDDSFVILGSPHSNPWSSLFQEQLDFDFVFDPDLKQEVIRNRRPKPDELARYVPTARGFDTGQAFAVIALANTRQNAPVLLLAGTNAEATAAAGEFVSNVGRLSSTMRRMGLPPSDQAERFEVLLGVRTMAGASTTFEIIAAHVLPAAVVQ